MASMALPLDAASQSTVTHPANAVSKTSSKNYLNQLITIDPEQSWKGHVRSERAWKALAITIAVALTAFAAAATIAVGIYAGLAYAPLAILVTCLVVEKAINGVLKLWKKAESHSIKAEVDQKAALEMVELKKMSSDELIDELKSMGIDSSDIRKVDKIKVPETLRAAMAYYRAWGKETKEAQTSIDALQRDMVAKAKDPDFVQLARKSILIYQDVQLLYKVRQAYVHSVILNPTNTAEFTDIVAVNLLNCERQYLAEKFHATDAHAFIHLKSNADRPAITREDIDRMSIPDLADRMFA